jgi:hypothetical protein
MKFGELPLWKRIAYIISMCVLIGSIILTLLAEYWILIPVTPIVVKNPTALETNSKVYRAGEQIIYTLDYCKKKDFTARVSRAFVDGFRVNYNAMTSSLPVGCYVQKIADLKVPEFIGPGTYHIEITVDYQVNPLQTVSVKLRTKDFKVIK